MYISFEKYLQHFLKVCTYHVKGTYTTVKTYVLHVISKEKEKNVQQVYK
jgi:hypothetical protein